MSSTFKRPESSYDRLSFLSPSGSGDRVKLLEHPNMEIERVFTCVGCGMHIAVGPCFEHIDAATFLGVVCGCLDAEPLESLTGTVEAEGSAGKGQEAQPSA